MPLLYVTLTPGVFNAAAKQKLVKALTEAAFIAESVPDLPASRARGMILLQELPAGQFYSNSEPADGKLGGVFINYQLPAGVLDGARKTKFAQALNDAVDIALGKDRPYPVFTSAVIHEVTEGQWAQNGKILRLPDNVSITKFEHLVSMIEGA
ncbi:phenylpyruvate tautomerase PptA (4-oxalocrotonate tautomerase family) [Bradyrhizobium sp. USDA 4516]